MKESMTHAELQKLLTESMDAMEARLEGRMLGIEMKQNTFIEGVLKRLGFLEANGVNREKILDRVETKVSSIEPMVRDLRDLLAVWARRQDDGK